MGSFLLFEHGLVDVLNHPNENGITIFVIGILFILSVYHFLLYFQHKDKAYLYYSLYTFMIFFGLLNRSKVGFVIDFIEPIRGFIDHLELNFILSYNLIYIVFVYDLLDFKKHLNKWYHFFYWTVRIIFLYAVILELLYVITGDMQILMKGHPAFSALTYLSGLLLFISLFKLKSPLRFYIVMGGFFLLMTSLVVSIIKRIGLSPEEQEVRYSIFYIGLVIENIFFALAPGYKQKLILDERNRSQETLIAQFRENEDLRSKVQAQLEGNVKAMEIKAEAERLKGLQTQYDKELAELKLLALRSAMNPHFIFNSLNSIKRYIIDSDKEKAVYYMNKFAKLIRRILASTMEKESSLSDELETMELYVNIENLRFSNEIEFSIACGQDINPTGIKIPSLLLQPFLENAIWHGLSPKKENMELKIILSKHMKTQVRIEILDNGIGLRKSRHIKERKVHKNDSVGISLSKERLEHFSQQYETEGQIVILDMETLEEGKSGTKVVIDLPYTYQ
ncbi:histidine kinase [Maribacter litopenaei]|uniref:Histidine kinase n=1 Tax=Maribacter litopenaei TaxID=2976127 RepID=A0ABY5Y5P4_9FLAO|nr:7TM diverse intracellular signaling domain-containing protein [Maribacter litopenaei]UWX54356.1 histidine kinase [Maribacter litopenaei]